MSATTPQPLNTNLQKNLDAIEQIFTYPKNNALSIRHVHIQALKKKAAIIYIHETALARDIQLHIIEPLLELQPDDVPEDLASGSIPVFLIENALETAKTEIAEDLDTVTERLIGGHTIIIVDGVSEAISADTSNFQRRQVSEAKVEHAVKGSKEAFAESLAVNMSLIRKQIRSPDLIAETVTISRKTRDTVTVVYMKNIADPNLVEEVKRRITSLDVDAVIHLTFLEQLIEEQPYSLIPPMMTTERPDRTCSFLLEGQIAVLMENSPFALILPITFWSLFHSGEDMFLRWGYGNFIRLIRFIALFVALLTPSIYLAISTFHVEMLPTDLMLAIAATRERVPFNSFIEVLFIEICFEILREAAVRVPSVIGPTIGIVGALILGQAAVEANIISPILVIVVAITGLSSFAISDLSLNYTVRIMRFVMLFAAGFIGFYGIAVVMAFWITRLVAYRPFGVPFLSPLSPHERSSGDLIFRPTAKKQKWRPFNYNPQERVRR